MVVVVVVVLLVILVVLVVVLRLPLLLPPPPPSPPLPIPWPVASFSSLDPLNLGIYPPPCWLEGRSKGAPRRRPMGAWCMMWWYVVRMRYVHHIQKGRGGGMEVVAIIPTGNAFRIVCGCTMVHEMMLMRMAASVMACMQCIGSDAAPSPPPQGIIAAVHGEEEVMRRRLRRNSGLYRPAVAICLRPSGGGG